MDLKKTGEFIKQQRKAKNLTQAQLAEKLFVSEKTISKWECGNGFPDTTLMMPLCQVLGISANELLSAKKLDEKEYKAEAEKNLVVLGTEKERSDRLLLTIEWVLGIVSMIVLFASVIVGAVVELPVWARVVIIVVGICVGLFGLHFCTVIETKAGYYECAKCHHKYIPTLSQVYLSMHFGRTRYMKCPNCHKHSWNKKVIK